MWLKKEALEKLKEDGISVEDLCDKVTSLNCLRTDTSITFFVDERIERLYSCRSVVVVFGILNPYWSYLSYHLLEHVICQSSSEDLRKQMEEFKAEVDLFKEETPLGMFAGIEKKIDSEIPDGFRKLISKHKFSKDSFLKEVEKVRVELKNEYRFEECALLLNDVLPGSTKIVWLIPKSAVEHVQQVTSTLVRGRFRSIMMVKLELQGECIYEDYLTSEVQFYFVLPNNVLVMETHVPVLLFISVMIIQVAQALPTTPPSKKEMSTTPSSKEEMSTTPSSKKAMPTMIPPRFVCMQYYVLCMCKYVCSV